MILSYGISLSHYENSFAVDPLERNGSFSFIIQEKEEKRNIFLRAMREQRHIIKRYTGKR